MFREAKSGVPLRALGAAGAVGTGLASDPHRLAAHRRRPADIDGPP